MSSIPVISTGGEVEETPNFQPEPSQPTNDKEGLVELGEQIKLFSDGVTKLKQVGKELQDTVDASFRELRAIVEQRNNPILINMLNSLSTQIKNFSTRVQKVASLEQQEKLLEGLHDALENEPCSQEAEYARKITVSFDQIRGESSSAGASSGSPQTPMNAREIV